MIIREIKKVDDYLVEIFKILMTQLNPKAPVVTRDILEEIMITDNIVLLVAEDAGEIIGTLTLVTYRIPIFTHGRIENVIVDEKHRNNGIGKQLLIHALDEAKKRKIDIVNLTSNPERKEANAFYKRMGFEDYETNNYKYHL